MVASDFVLLLEVFHVVGWSYVEMVSVLEDGKVIVCSGINFESPV